MVFADILDLLELLYGYLTDFGSFVVSLFTMKIPDLLTMFLPFDPPGFNAAFILLGLEDETILTLMLGGGLAFFIVYMIVTWVLNIWIG